jgi:hypothetical protein
MLNLGVLGFVSPWILSALLLLPLLWWLLRVTPPAPQRIAFPAIRLLFGLKLPEETPAASPWWLVLLRLLAAALIILALSHPLLAPNKKLGGLGPLILLVDNGWAAAQNWTTRQETLRQFIDQADRENRSVVLLPTAPSANGRLPEISRPMNAADARIAAGAMTPNPWPTNRAAALEAIRTPKLKGPATAIWLSDGLGDEFASPLAEQLQRHGETRVLAPTPTDLPHVLEKPDVAGAKLTVIISRATATANDAPMNLRALALDGRVLAYEPVLFESDARETTVTIDLPLELRNEITRLELEHQSTAAGVFLTDERWRRRPVGVVSAQRAGNSPSLLSEIYYLERSLAPFNDVSTGALKTLLDRSFSVIAIPDAATIDSTQADALRRWAKKGGLILRFAGPRLAQDRDDLLSPTALRRGGRTLGGAMRWTKPARLAPFEADSPFANLDIPADVTVSRQVLAQPTLDLNEKTWARLGDGTPLVTADRIGAGWLVLVHTSSNATWSTLPLSGLFVDMLQRIVAMSEGVDGQDLSNRPLPPVEILDGFGRIARPAVGAKSISSRGDVEIGPAHPPGLYGYNTTRRALNLGPGLSLEPMGPLPTGVAVETYAQRHEFDLKPWFLAAAFLLLIVDAFISLLLRGFSPRWPRWPQWRTTATFILCIGLSTFFLTANPSLTLAQNGVPEASIRTSIAYVLTGDNGVDTTSKQGLTGLAALLDRRTAIEAVLPVGIDLESAELAFFPLIYWPITTSQAALSRRAIQRLNHYLASGGTIFFDLRDQGYGGGFSGEMGQRLQNLTRGLNIPSMIPTPPNHILTKAFYLMEEFPGRWAGGRLWVERPGARVNDGVSSIIVGSNDWAAAWAEDASGLKTHPVVPGGEQQREMAYRFGVNLVMYLLTGNYKSDQVHVPAILERLGQ